MATTEYEFSQQFKCHTGIAIHVFDRSFQPVPNYYISILNYCVNPIAKDLLKTKQLESIFEFCMV